MRRWVLVFNLSFFFLNSQLNRNVSRVLLVCLTLGSGSQRVYVATQSCVGPTWWLIIHQGSIVQTCSENELLLTGALRAGMGRATLSLAVVYWQPQGHKILVNEKLTLLYPISSTALNAKPSKIIEKNLQSLVDAKAEGLWRYEEPLAALGIYDISHNKKS